MENGYNASRMHACPSVWVDCQEIAITQSSTNRMVSVSAVNSHFKSRIKIIIKNTPRQTALFITAEPCSVLMLIVAVYCVFFFAYTYDARISEALLITGARINET